MADKLWYTYSNGQQAGPFSEAQMRDLIARGQVQADTLVWAAPMPGWVKASEAGLMAAAAPPPAPGVPPVAPSIASAPSVARAAPGVALAAGGAAAQAADALAFTGGTWPLLGRSLLVGICQYLVIPAPWANTSFYRWFVDHLALPNGKTVAFTGQPGDIWYIFILLALCNYAGLLHPALPLLAIPLSILFYLIIMRWFFARLVWPGQTAPLAFTGGYWPLLGWTLAIAVSAISIIGWAWVTTAALRWVCRQIQGSNHMLTFVAGGWSVLWRSFVFAFVCAFIIPIPWMLRWYVRWMMSQFHLVARA